MDYQKKYLKYKNKYYKFLIKNKLNENKLLGGNLLSISTYLLTILTSFVSLIIQYNTSNDIKLLNEILKDYNKKHLGLSDTIINEILNKINKDMNKKDIEVLVENTKNPQRKILAEQRDKEADRVNSYLDKSKFDDNRQNILDNSSESLEEKSSDMKESYGGSPESVEEKSSDMEESYGGSPESVEEKSSDIEESYGGSPESVEEEKSSDMEESYGGSPESVEEKSSDMEESYGGSPESVEEKSSDMEESYGGSPESVEEEKSSDMKESYGGSPESLEERSYDLYESNDSFPESYKSLDIEESYGGSPESLEEKSSDINELYGRTPESLEDKSLDMQELYGGTPDSKTSSLADELLEELSEKSTSSIVEDLIEQTGGYIKSENNLDKLSKTSYDINTDESKYSVNSMVLDDLSNTSIEGGYIKNSGSMESSEMTNYDEEDFPITKSIFIKLVENLKKSKKIKVSKMNVDCMNKIINKIKKSNNVNNKVLLDFKNIVNNINKSIKKYNYNDTCNSQINKYLMLFMNKL